MFYINFQSSLNFSEQQSQFDGTTAYNDKSNNHQQDLSRDETLSCQPRSKSTMIMSQTAARQSHYFKNLLSTGDFSDLTIVCRGKEFKVHKWIFAASSSVLSKLVIGNFKEAQEGASRINFPDDEPDVLGALIHFLYNYTYADDMATSCSLICFAVKVYASADKYEISELKTLAAAVFRSKFVMQGDNFEELMDAISYVEVFTAECDQTLWGILLPVLKKNIKKVMEDEVFGQYVQERKDLNRRLLLMLQEGNDGSTQPRPTDHPYIIQPHLLREAVAFGTARLDGDFICDP